MTEQYTVRRQDPIQPTALIPAENLPETLSITIVKTVRTELAGTTSIDPELRRQMVADEAYFLAEKRGFEPGHDVDDWLAAEAIVDSRLEQMQAA
jgi:hypothetical protein